MAFGGHVAFAEGGSSSDPDDQYGTVSGGDLDRAAAASMDRWGAATPEQRTQADPSASHPLLGRLVGAGLTALLPGVGALSQTDVAQKRLSDPNFYRTFAQGLMPWSDEAEAGVRSLFGSGRYRDYLDEARRGRTNYGVKVGPTEAGLTEGAGTLASLMIGGGGGAALKGGVLASRAPQLAAWMARNPRLAAMIPMAGAGAFRGAGEGEDGEDRLNKALMGGIEGAGWGLAGHTAGQVGRWALPRVARAFGYGQPSRITDPTRLLTYQPEEPVNFAFSGS